MQDQPSLLSRMKDPYQELQDQEILNLRDHYLQDTTFNLQTPSLLMRMSDPRTLQGLPLSQTQNSIKMYSSDVMPSSNDIVRGRSRKGQFMSRSNQSSPKRLEMIERDQMQLLDCSLQLLKAMIRRLEQQQVKGERSTQISAPPALLYRFQMGTSQTKSMSPRESKSTSQLMHGSLVDEINAPCYETPSPKHSNSSKSTLSIPKQPRGRLLTNQTVQSFQIRNGRTSSLEELLTSTPSSANNSPPPITIRKLKSSVTLRSPLEQLSPLSQSRAAATGSLPGIKLLERLSSHSPTDCKSSLGMESTSSTCSPSPTHLSILESSPSIEQSGKGSEVSETLSSGISRNLLTSKSHIWTRSGFQLSQDPPKMIGDKKRRKEKTGRKTNHATNGTMKNVAKRKRVAEDYMSATSAEREVTRERTVGSDELASESKWPKYMERSVWTDVDTAPLVSPTATCTLSDGPLPRPSSHEFLNLDATRTVRDHPHLFKIVTPINVDRFEKLLEAHPNKQFV